MYIYIHIYTNLIHRQTDVQKISYMVFMGVKGQLLHTFIKSRTESFIMKKKKLSLEIHRQMIHLIDSIYYNNNKINKINVASPV